MIVLDYLPSEYSSATLAAASVLSAVQQVPDELRFALESFIKTALADTTIKMVSTKTIESFIKRNSILGQKFFRVLLRLRRFFLFH
jgi:hypothetical protein